MKKEIIVWDKMYSLGAKFPKATSFLISLKQKVLEKYLRNIVRVGIEVSRCSKVLKMRDVQGYHLASKTVHF